MYATAQSNLNFPAFDQKHMEESYLVMPVRGSPLGNRLVHLVRVTPLRGLDHPDPRHAALDRYVVGLVVVVGLLIDNQQLGLRGKGLDPLDHLLVGLVRDVDLVDLDNAIALPQAGRLARRALVHLPYELAIFTLLGVQVEPVAVEIVPLDYVAQPRARIFVMQVVHLEGLSKAKSCSSTSTARTD